MKNCLVTKLKGVVNNDNLVKIGEYKMHINVGSATDVKIFGSNGTITILGNNNYYFTKNGQQTKTIEYSPVAATWPAGEYDVLFTNKYAITMCDGAKGIDLEVFAFSNGLNYINASNVRGDITFLNGKTLTLGFILTGVSNYGVTGPLSAIASATKNAATQIQFSSIVGDIALLGNTGSKQISVVECPYITGSLEGLVAAIASDPINPFTSGSKKVFIAGSSVTINGQINKNANENTQLIMEDATHWYYPSMGNDKINNASYNVTIYAKNPTKEQIAAWEANNNTVVVLG